MYETNRKKSAKATRTEMEKNEMKKELYKYHTIKMDDEPRTHIHKHTH